MSANIPDWFHNTVVSGFQGLYSLGLQGSPAAEISDSTMSVWITVLWDRVAFNWGQELDRERLAIAFQQLAMNSGRWPPPAALVKLLPPRPQPIALPEPESKGPSPEIKARLMKSIKVLAGKMTRTLWSN